MYMCVCMVEENDTLHRKKQNKDSTEHFSESHSRMQGKDENILIIYL